MCDSSRCTVGDSRIALVHLPLHLDRTAHSVNHAREFGKEAIADLLHHPAAVFCNFGLNQLPEMRLQAIVRPLLIRAHQTRVAGHIGGEDRGKTADRRHFVPSDRLA
jgi:hypothetical protein